MKGSVVGRQKPRHWLSHFPAGASAPFISQRNQGCGLSNRRSLSAGGNIKKPPLISHKAAANGIDLCKCRVRKLGAAPMSDDDKVQSHETNGARLMDEAFCARMRRAIAAGLESAPVGVVTTPGTKEPKYVLPEQWPLGFSLGAMDF